MKKLIYMIALAALLASPHSMAVGKDIKIKTIEDVLKKLNKQTKDLVSLEAEIEYLYVQDPELLDSRTLQKGKFYYKKYKDRSKIRIDFLQRKIDEEPEEKYFEQVTFDGVWLARIDHQMKTAKYDQQAAPDKPVEAFEFVGRNFPLIGFTKINDLKKHYDIKLAGQKPTDPIDPSKPIHLNLATKPDSKYAKDYAVVQLMIDNNIFLPIRLVTKTPEGDIYVIKLEKAKINKKIENSIFNVEPPADFVQDKRTLEEKTD